MSARSETSTPPAPMTEAMALFDAGPATPQAPELSRAQRITIRNRRLLDAGIHPATHRPLLVCTGETCSSCTRLNTAGDSSRRYYKCTKHRLGTSHSDASDIRISWPACLLYEAR